MADSINLSSAVRSTFSTINQTTQLGVRTDQRLATGQAINSPIDGAAEFFASLALSDRASGLNAAKEGVDQALSTIDAAQVGLDAIGALAEQAEGIAIAAQNTSDPNQRAALESQFNELTNQINGIAQDSGFGGTNLVQSDNLDISLNETGSSTETIEGVDASAAGLGFGAADFSSDAGIQAALGQAASAVDATRSNAATLASSSSALQTRINFTEDLANTLEEGAAKLTEADLTEEAANRLSLQTRQSLSNNALGLATQSERAILGLFA